MYIAVFCGECGARMALVEVSSPDRGTTFVQYFVCPICGREFTREMSPYKPTKRDRRGVK